MKKHWPWLILTLIILFSLFIRTYRLNLDLPTLYGDETGGHYQALQTLVIPTDPVHKAYYLLQNGTATFTWAFGLTPLGVRLPAAIYGTLAILALYFFVSGFSTQRIALLTTLIASVSPWNFMLSRIGHPHLLLMLIFVLVSLAIFLHKKSPKNLVLCLLFLTLAVYEYPSMIIIAPIIILFLLSQNISRKVLIPSLFFVGLMVFIALFMYKGFSLSGRGLDLAIWRDVNVTADNNLFRGIAGESMLTKIFYNYPMSVVGAFVKNYLSFFSPDFLFLKGDPILRHSTGMVGAFLPLTLPFMLYGAFKFFSEEKPKIKKLFLIWILISPIPAAITKDGASYLLRAVTLMPFLTYFIALGIIKTFDLIRQRSLKVIYALLLLFVATYSVGSFLYGYLTVYPALSAKSYEVGFKDLALFQHANNNTSMLVVWHGFYPDTVFRFWQQTPFADYQEFKPFDHQINHSVFRQTYENLIIGRPDNHMDLKQAIETIKPDYLAIPVSYIYESAKEPDHSVNYPDSTPAFFIYKIKP